MISIKVTISPNLKQKMRKSWMDNNISNLIDGVGTALLWNVQEYGFGSAGGNTPGGGSPIWQEKVTVQGHYRGYLRESHYLKKKSLYNIQIVSSADFIDGVIEGYSTNWEGVRFGANYYHKRAVDKLFVEGKIPTIWKNAVNNERTSWVR